MKKIILFVLLLYPLTARSQTVATPWSPAVTPITEAGSDYGSANTLTSAVDHTLFTVDVPSAGLFATNHYTVYLLRTDTGLNWNTAGLQIWSRRTGNGYLGGIGSTISGGLTYQPIGTASAYFFEGANYLGIARISIPLQYQITGVSVLVPVANYVTTLTFTISDD